MCLARNAVRTGLLAIGLAVACTSAAAPNDRISFRRQSVVLLKIDERPVKHWEVYLSKDRKHLVLLQLGGRYLLFDTDAREVYELEPNTLAPRRNELLWTEQKPPATTAESSGEAASGQPTSRMKRIASEDWVLRDAGRARIVRVKLSEEGRVIEIQLPIQPDLRSLY
jgi:hypothetical protein